MKNLLYLSLLLISLLPASAQNYRATYDDGGVRVPTVLTPVTVQIPTNGVLPFPSTSAFILDQTVATNISSFSGLIPWAIYRVYATNAANFVYGTNVFTNATTNSTNYWTNTLLGPTYIANGTNNTAATNLALSATRTCTILATSTNSAVILNYGP